MPASAFATPSRVFASGMSTGIRSRSARERMQAASISCLFPTSA